MAKKVLLKNSDGTTVMPITRGELILDSSGNPALHSSQFLATDSQPGLIGSSQVFNLTSISINKNWQASGILLNENNGFVSGLYLIKISSGNLIFSGIASVFVGPITTEDEIVLHMCGIPQTYTDGNQGRVYVKIAPSQIAECGEVYLATNTPQASMNLSIIMKKLI